MDCRQAKELLTENLAMSLMPEEKAALNDHLSGCEDCRAEAKSLEVAWRVLGSLEALSPPLHVKARLFRAIEAERRRENTILSSLRRFLPASLTAGLVSLAVAFIFPYQWFANLCHSWLGIALGTADWPMEPFFFLVGGLYSSLPMYLTFKLLTSEVNLAPARSAALAGAIFLAFVSPYVLVECMALSFGSAASLVTGFIAGTLLSTSARAWDWKVKLDEVLA